jgi:tetratricopeptide (TPR) repeat protein
MDRRIRRLCAAFLPVVLSASGCYSLGDKPLTANPDFTKLQKPAKPTDAPHPSSARAAAGAETKHNEPPKPETLCAIAAVRDQMAENPEVSFAEAEQTRASARKMYQQSIAQDPKYIQAYIGLAKSFASIDDYGQAVKMYEKAIEQQPHNGNLWYDKALLQARFKDWDGSVASFKTAQKIDPDNRQYARMLGMTQARAGKFDDALATLTKCMKEEEARFTIARMYLHLDRTEEARQQLTLALKAHPTFAPAHEMLAEMQQVSGGSMNPIRTVAHAE